MLAPSYRILKACLPCGFAETLTTGSYSIERTCRMAKQDGSDTHVTCEIVTDHSVAYCM